MYHCNLLPFIVDKIPLDTHQILDWLANVVPFWTRYSILTKSLTDWLMSSHYLLFASIIIRSIGSTCGARKAEPGRAACTWWRRIPTCPLASRSRQYPWGEVAWGTTQLWNSHIHEDIQGIYTQQRKLCTAYSTNDCRGSCKWVVEIHQIFILYFFFWHWAHNYTFKRKWLCWFPIFLQFLWTWIGGINKSHNFAT